VCMESKVGKHSDIVIFVYFYTSCHQICILYSKIINIDEKKYFIGLLVQRTLVTLSP